MRSPLRGGRLYLALAGNFVLGGLMTLGIGLYAPCMILVNGVALDGLDVSKVPVDARRHTKFVVGWTLSAF